MNDTQFTTQEDSSELVATIHPIYKDLSDERKLRFLNTMKSFVEDELKKLES